MKGFNFYFGSDCNKKIFIEEKLLQYFSERKFQRIEVPSVHYYDFEANPAINVNSTIRAMDTDGSMIMLCPDISYLVCQYINGLKNIERPIRVAHKGRDFLLVADESGDRERTKIGADIIGDDSAEAEAEMIIMAIESMRTLGIRDFKVELSHVDYLGGILKMCNFSPSDYGKVTSAIEKNDRFTLQLIQAKYNLSDQILRAFEKTDDLCGEGDGVLTAGKKNAINETSLNAIERLIKVYEILTEKGYRKYLLFDLSLSANPDYYSGIVFKLLTKYSNAPLVGGGRCDNLTRCDEGDTQVGFSININELLRTYNAMGIKVKG